MAITELVKSGLSLVICARPTNSSPLSPEACSINCLTVEDVIVLAGGLREAASIINVEVARRLKDPSATRSSNQTAETFNFTLDEGLAVTSGDTLFTLEPGEKRTNTTASTMPCTVRS